ncbi:hypothetical protein LC2W_1418 [Lacticaseibacillus paracasei]|uniref:Uncharacterized protein n=1 Tax=Lacticaseibacillus paracasei subsp. paracasei Lpp49 TaxID=1256213 RepID=A0ABC9TAN3_LACPA|nr:hypothetical protein [Lacticaseibacillus paracasei]EPC33264.1 hypothetical protein Lpp223_1660 [Lacticaseibacillus paracasei subsp. paracasei Lpp223]EPC61479.1 hypothetical protein Lpp189_02292 [Lacticaseibacillus paracasei subsp. paracasei Lpp189]EPC81877.1 hypothetical protein Lpp37_10878 [Lacticaseibacillus paracasei subsp. paracasei Lpp37]EPD00731.1 hypothetical protein Lpp125_08059 [Lacticaseibacillus paracasei subsp. paracasei Lpp125]AEA53752.1 hypothetical protein LC2W_1418 [Lacticas
MVIKIALIFAPSGTPLNKKFLRPMTQLFMLRSVALLLQSMANIAGWRLSMVVDPEHT